MHELIELREAALRLLGGGRAGEVLNAGALPTAMPARADLPDALAAAVREIKLAAISANGARVEYAALRASDAYARYRAEVTAHLPAFDPLTLSSRAERLAFWINLYNALIIDGVVAYAVRDSVMRFAPVAGFFRRIAYTIGGRRLSADDIEHGILRANAGSPFLPGPQFSANDPRLLWIVAPPDPRIHFALNCASRSCPPIAAYSAAQIEAQLAMAARAFVAADAAIDPATGTLRLSKIFDWYRADFGGHQGVIRFVNAHLSDDERSRWLAAQTELDLVYTPYDWGLNGP
jgi:hypothetical protein